MEQRVDLAKQAQAMAEHALEQTLQACTTHLATVGQAIEIGTARFEYPRNRHWMPYLATNPSAAQFHAWLKWNPAKMAAL